MLCHNVICDNCPVRVNTVLDFWLDMREEGLQWMVAIELQKFGMSVIGIGVLGQNNYYPDLDLRSCN